MIISNQKKFIFFKPRKVAGTSIEAYLNQYLNPEIDIATKIIDYNPKYDETKYELRYFNHERFYNHIEPFQVLKKIGPINFFKYFKFTVVRNPFDALVSYYNYVNPDMNFKDFIRNRYLDNTPYYFLTVKNIPTIKSCDFYIRYENLQEDFNHVCTLLDIPHKDLPKTKTKFRNANDSYREYFDQESIDLVESKNKLILNKFNYSF